MHPSAKGALLTKTEDSELTVLDGPFTEAKEVIGGFALINAADRAEAVGYAREFISMFEGFPVSVEVRQVVEMSDLPQ